MLEPEKMIYQTSIKEKLAKIWCYVFPYLSQIVLVVTILGIYHLYYNPRVGVVNVTGIVNSFLDAEQKQNLSPVEMKVQTKTFAVALEKAMREVSASKHVVLLANEAVMAGARDYTQAIQTHLAKMAKGSALGELAAQPLPAAQPSSVSEAKMVAPKLPVGG